MRDRERKEKVTETKNDLVAKEEEEDPGERRTLSKLR